MRSVRRRSWGAALAGVTVVVAVGASVSPAAGDVRDITPACPAFVPHETFIDVWDDNPHRAAIECIVWWGVVKGTGSTAPGSSFGFYSPTAAVSRGQVAALVVRTIEASEAPLPLDPPNRFADDDGSPLATSIDQLAELGIVSGFGDGTYRPRLPITRGQLAAIVVSAVEHVTGSTMPAGPDAFADDASAAQHDAINAAAAAGLLAGTAERTFEPGAPLTRAQAASVLARVLALFTEQGMVDRPPAPPDAVVAMQRGMDPWTGSGGIYVTYRWAVDVFGIDDVSARVATHEDGRLVGRLIFQAGWDGFAEAFFRTEPGDPAANEGVGYLVDAAGAEVPGSRATTPVETWPVSIPLQIVG